MALAKNHKVSKKNLLIGSWSNFAFYILVECPLYVKEQILETESILLRSDYDTPSHSAWLESSAARPPARGGRRGSEKLAPSAFAMLQRRGPQGRAHIWVVFSCKGGERGKWRGPKGQADALDIVVLWRKDDRVARPVGPSRRAHFRHVWSKTPNSSHRRLAIGSFQGNQYVTLSSSVLFRTLAL